MMECSEVKVHEGICFKCPKESHQWVSTIHFHVLHGVLMEREEDDLRS
jgi:hypothetical protein